MTNLSPVRERQDGVHFPREVSPRKLSLEAGALWLWWPTRYTPVVPVIPPGAFTYAPFPTPNPRSRRWEQVPTLSLPSAFSHRWPH